MDIPFPVSLAEVLTVPGVAILTALILEWLKQWITQKRVLNLVSLGVALPLAVLGEFIARAWHPGAEAVYMVVLVTLFGASLACFGYETVKNIVGLMGVLKRPGA